MNLMKKIGKMDDIKNIDKSLTTHGAGCEDLDR